MDSENKKPVTIEFKVDAYDNVYDDNGVFYCKWDILTKDEKRLVKKNQASAR